MSVDPVALTQELIRCPSVTPEEGGAIVLLDKLMSEAGFRTERVDRNGIANLFARWGEGRNGRTFGFNGHTDVVPVGDPADWTHDPFGAEIVDGILYGRGACDMKSGVAAFAAAAIDFVRDTPPDGSIVLTITGDEEGDGVDGTAAILDWMDAQGERMDHCLVGEPTCPERMGEMMKIGRRGSMTAWITATGRQGHAAYPHRALNPLPPLVRYLDRLASRDLDGGTDHFDPSTLAIVTVDTGNPANNVIPAKATACVNIRFNDAHHSDDLSAWLRQEAQQIARESGVAMDLRIKVSGESFVTPPGELSDLIGAAVEAETGVAPTLSTTGGTSDARFVKDHCPVVEFGLVGQSMHQVDEHVAVAHVHQLKAIYTRILEGYFAR
ncbi:succinyl-diaminopimelate desuccinylase [Roseobacter sp. HKCCA0434]|uniref:succinyl-diaminopimelate desuccinylase n=1 Tax=Roseobacter sp. HKCCA0434 TaxID=3079297 RepID=UPI002905C325|nr:succinyl-diaminopimelate desuccinylase [Roseobacter sp. HKCCA0434]